MKEHPQNHFNFCPRCGKSVTFNSESFSIHCSSCGFQLYINSAAAVTALIFNGKNELLFTHRGVEPAIGKLDLPGGFVDPGENIETALHREIKEELDLDIKEFSYFGSFPNDYVFAGLNVYTIDLVFKCQIKDISQLKYRDDIIGLEFIKLDDIDLADIPFKSAKNIVKKLLNDDNKK